VKILITGIAGFVGSQLATFLAANIKGASISGIDNLMRKGASGNLSVLAKIGCEFIQGDIRDKALIESLPRYDWIIDCAADPSVLSGLNNDVYPLIDNNLIATFHLLEKCRRDTAGFILPSTSRVYSINALNSLKLKTANKCFLLDETGADSWPAGFSAKGVSESFPVTAPVSLYGATKLASEIMALEYHYAFGFPVWINRCGVLAGAGQFGKIDQGIFSFWVYQYLLNRPLTFIGYGGKGYQARDMLHPEDLGRLILQQIFAGSGTYERVFNLGGGVSNTMSLALLDVICKQEIDPDKVINADLEMRKYDIPLYITDYSLAETVWGWKPLKSAEQIIDEIIGFAKSNRDFVADLYAN
jgi:CDP-paratose 2-epimerase